MGAVLPLTDLDIEVLARAREQGVLPALVPSSEVARATYDKYEAHLLLRAPSAALAPDGAARRRTSTRSHYPVMVKPRRGSGARSIHLARDPAQARFFVDYVQEPTMVQRAMGGPELSIDCLGDREGRCLNAIPRTMLESRGGESIKGQVIHDEELIELGRTVMERCGVRGPATIQVFRDPDIGVAHHRRQHALRRRLPRARLRRPARPQLPGADRARWRPASSPSPHVGRVQRRA